MNQDYYNNKFKVALSKLRKLNVSELILSKYQDKLLSEIKFSRFSADQFVNYINRTLENFENQDRLENWQFWNSNAFLPINNNRGIDIDFLIGNLITNIQNQDFTEAEQSLWGVVNFQIRYSFWENKDHISIDEENLDRQIKYLKEQGKIYDTHIKNSLKSISDLQNDLTEKAKSLEEINKKKSELETILSSVHETNKKYAEVDGAITALKESNEQVIADLKVTLADSKTLNKETTAENLKILDLAKKASANFDQINQKLSESKKLLSLMADWSLGNSFADRASKIKNNVTFWKYIGIPITFGMAVLWLWGSYKYINIETTNEFVRLLIFSGKLSLGLYLVYFAMKEYTKERKLLEEYSFKTAVSLTVNPYGDEIGKAEHTSEGEDGLSYSRNREHDRQSFIKDTVSKLYEKPTYSDKLEKSSVQNLTEEVLSKVKNNVNTQD